MWKEIMESKSGKEFGEWLGKNYIIGRTENSAESVNGFYKGVEWIRDNIINNLAIDWLDSNKIHIYVNPCIGKDFDFMSRIYDRNKDVIKIVKLNCKTRQEAIAAGVKKAFELLEK